jgi:hypothetical protein
MEGLLSCSTNLKGAAICLAGGPLYPVLQQALPAFHETPVFCHTVDGVLKVCCDRIHQTFCCPSLPLLMRLLRRCTDVVFIGQDSNNVAVSCDDGNVLVLALTSIGQVCPSLMSISFLSLMLLQTAIRPLWLAASFAL